MKALAPVGLLGVLAIFWAVSLMREPSDSQVRRTYWQSIAYPLIFSETEAATYLLRVDHDDRAKLDSLRPFFYFEALYTEHLLETTPIPPDFGTVHDDLVHAVAQERIWTTSQALLVDYCVVLLTPDQPGGRLSCSASPSPNPAAVAFARTEWWYRKAQTDALHADRQLSDMREDTIGSCWMPHYTQWLRAQSSAYDDLAAFVDDNYATFQREFAPRQAVLPCK